MTTNHTGLLLSEQKLSTYLDLVIVNVRRRSEREFDMDIDYIAPGAEGTTGWMPLVLLHEEWKRRPKEIGGLVEAAGGRCAEDVAKDWDYLRDLDDFDKYTAMCHGIWALVEARARASE